MMLPITIPPAHDDATTHIVSTTRIDSPTHNVADHGTNYAASHHNDDDVTADDNDAVDDNDCSR